MPLSLTPAYNLKAVLKETGIKPDVLRAWERRYGIPMPQRTSGGHRLYSEHDIEMIKWLIVRQNEGLSISRAVEMWKEHASQGIDPLSAVQTRSVSQYSANNAQPPIYQPPETGIDAMRLQWLTACINFNEPAAEQVLNQAFALYPVETVCVEVLQRGMADIGSMWFENRASVQQEHFASGLAMRRIGVLISASPAPSRGQTIIIGCPSDEWHAFTPLLMALFLRRRGLNVIYLGANVPPEHFEETVEAVSARLVVLASQQLNTAASLQQSAALISAQNISVAFGGRAFLVHPELGERIAGHYLGDRLESAIDRIEILLASRPANPQPATPSAEYVDALKAFTAKRSSLEASFDEETLARGANMNYIKDAHKFMGDNIIACLQLGDINFLDSEVDWLTLLLQGQNLSTKVIDDYLEIYWYAAHNQLGGNAAPLERWIEKQIKRRQAA